MRCNSKWSSKLQAKPLAPRFRMCAPIDCRREKRVCCVQQSTSTSIYQCAQRFSTEICVSVLLRMLHCCRWCITLHFSITAWQASNSRRVIRYLPSWSMHCCCCRRGRRADATLPDGGSLGRSWRAPRSGSLGGSLHTCALSVWGIWNGSRWSESELAPREFHSRSEVAPRGRGCVSYMRRRRRRQNARTLSCLQLLPQHHV